MNGGIEGARSPRPLLEPAAVAAALLVGGVLVATQFPAGGNDDSHITYWAAHALARLGRIVNYDGRPVEQSSSLGLVLLLGALEKMAGLPPPLGGWLVSLGAAAAAVAVLPGLARRLDGEGASWTPLVLATSVPFLYWSTSGMEMTLTALLGCVLARAAGRFVAEGLGARGGRALGAAAAAATFALVRPETPLVLVAALGTVALAQGWAFRRDPTAAARRRVVRALALLGLALVLVAALAAVRWRAFGALVPNCAAAKVGGFSLRSGASYLGTALAAGNLLLALTALVGAAALARDLSGGRAAPEAALVLGLAAATTAFVLGSGGDWMPGARLLCPLAPALALLAGRAIGWLSVGGRRLAALLGVGLLALGVQGVLAFGRSPDNGSYRGREAFAGLGAIGGADPQRFTFAELANRAHRRDARLLGVLLDVVDRLDPSAAHPLHLMSGQAGMVPFHVVGRHFGQVRFMDLFALTTPELATCLPPARRQPGIAGIRLDPQYLVANADRLPERCGARRPAVVFSTGSFPDWLRAAGYTRIYQGPPAMEAYVALDARMADRL